MSKSFKLNIPGVIELYKSAGMQNALQQAGDAVARAAGEGYAADTHLATFTAICTVYPSTKEAGVDNMLHNTLLKALGSAGLKLDHVKRKG